MACDKIMLIRHAERPDREKSIRGVALDGRKDKESLTVRGWQRAGALVRFFAPLDGHFVHQALARPRTLYACNAAPADPSLRPQHTLVPLAALLGIGINREHFHGDEIALVEDVLSSDGPALIAWKHDAMQIIANLILGDKTTAPQHWPYGRYDLVFVFDRRGERWTFVQIPQLLLAGDSAEPI
jgi:broad specificity phosphatase PhoE